MVKSVKRWPLQELNFEWMWMLWSLVKDSSPTRIRDSLEFRKERDP